MVIAYIGKERCEIPFFMYKIARTLNKKVLVVDNSLRGDLFRSVIHSEDTVAELDRAAFIRNYKIRKEDTDDFDVVILYNGLSNVARPYDLIPDFTYVETTMDCLEIEDVRAAVEACDFHVKCNLILNDVTTNKLSVETVVKDLRIATDTCFMLPLDAAFNSKYVMLTHNGDCRLKGSSEDMLDLISCILETQYGMNKKQIKKMMARL